MHYKRDILREIRNTIPVTHVIKMLGIPNKFIEGHLRFSCPKCQDMNTVTWKKTNLAHCKKCQVNFNVIDLFMQIKHFKFQETLDILSRMLPYYKKV